MRTIFCFVIGSLFFINECKADDSLDLFNRRVKALKEFSSWLSKEAKEEIAREGIYYQYDSASNKNWITFGKAIELFFNEQFLDSIIQNTKGQDNIFSPVFKSNMVKGLISRYNELSHRIAPDSLKFKPYHNSSKENLLQDENRIIQYFVIDGEIFDYLSFTFESGKTKLTGINVSEPQGEKGKKLFNYITSLKKGT
jgi:hypothetical protein